MQFEISKHTEMAVKMGCKQDAEKQNYCMIFTKFKTSLIVVSILLFIITLATLTVVVQSNHKQYQATGLWNTYIGNTLAFTLYENLYI